MEWGLAKVDHLGLESFIEATGTGQNLYAQYGYRPIKSVNVDMNRADASEEWKKLSAQLQIGYTAMWRPSEGIWRDGEPQITCEKWLEPTEVEVRSKKLAIHLGATQD